MKWWKWVPQVREYTQKGVFTEREASKKEASWNWGGYGFSENWGSWKCKWFSKSNILRDFCEHLILRHTHPTRICVEHVRNICIWSVSSIIWDRFLVMFTSLLLHTPHPMGIRRWCSRAAATAARAGRSAGGSRGTGGGRGGDGMREMATVSHLSRFFLENDLFWTKTQNLLQQLLQLNFKT